MTAEIRRRQELILTVVATEVIRSQEQLRAELAARGVTASQASLSRDVAALGLAKVGGRYTLPVVAGLDEDPSVRRVRTNLLSVARAGPHLLVLKTPPGEASPVALAIDRLAIPGVVGTVAGDDTLFAAIAEGADIESVAETLRAMQSGGTPARGGGEGG